MSEEIMRLLCKLTKKATKLGEVPVGCVITCDGKILTSGINSRNRYNNPLGHAEIVCVNNAAKLLGTWILDNCEMYVTLYPCQMCQEIIKECRIKKVHYILNKEKYVNRRVEYIKECCISAEMLRSEICGFFKDKR